MKTAKLILAAAFAGIAGIASLAATANALQTAWHVQIQLRKCRQLLLNV